MCREAPVQKRSEPNRFSTLGKHGSLSKLHPGNRCYSLFPHCKKYLQKNLSKWNNLKKSSRLLKHPISELLFANQLVKRWFLTEPVIKKIKQNLWNNEPRHLQEVDSLFVWICRLCAVETSQRRSASSLNDAHRERTFFTAWHALCQKRRRRAGSLQISPLRGRVSSPCDRAAVSSTSSSTWAMKPAADEPSLLSHRGLTPMTSSAIWGWWWWRRWCFFLWKPTTFTPALLLLLCASLKRNTMQISPSEDKIPVSRLHQHPVVVVCSN